MNEFETACYHHLSYARFNVELTFWNIWMHYILQNCDNRNKWGITDSVDFKMLDVFQNMDVPKNKQQWSYAAAGCYLSVTKGKDVLGLTPFFKSIIYNILSNLYFCVFNS